MKYFIAWLRSFSITFEISVKCIRLIVFPLGVIYRIRNREYVIFIGLPKYSVIITNEVGYLFSPDFYYVKYGHFYISHTVGLAITEKQEVTSP